MAGAAAVRTALSKPWIGSEGGATADIVTRSAAAGAAFASGMGVVGGQRGSGREKRGFGGGNEGWKVHC